MDDYFSISDLARRFHVAPRSISDLIYARKIDDSRHIYKAGRRLIPAGDVPEIRRALKDAGKLHERQMA